LPSWGVRKSLSQEWRSGDKMVSLSTVRAALFSAFIVFPAQLIAQELSTDPQGSGVIVGAARWVQGTLLGTVATVVAVIAVATVGFMMLTGRMNWRFGAVVILGCFILFGAASIVAGIQSAATLASGG
jgi:type IV secretion system protein VirB2